MALEEQEVAEHQRIGDYWYGFVDWTSTWMVRTNSGIVTRHCKEDAIQTANVAIMAKAKYRKQKPTFQQQVEYIMEDMLAYYEDMHDISKEIAMWADDYVAMTEQLVKP
jgi:hypothetical protein